MLQVCLRLWDPEWSAFVYFSRLLCFDMSRSWLAFLDGILSARRLLCSIHSAALHSFSLSC